MATKRVSTTMQNTRNKRVLEFYTTVATLNVVPLFVRERVSAFVKRYGSFAGSKFLAGLLRRFVGAKDNQRLDMQLAILQSRRQVAESQKSAGNPRNSVKRMREKDAFVKTISARALPLVRLMTTHYLTQQILPRYFSLSELSAWETPLAKKQATQEDIDLMLHTLEKRSGLSIQELIHDVLPLIVRDLAVLYRDSYTDAKVLSGQNMAEQWDQAISSKSLSSAAQLLMRGGK